jgi:hypothetical protein
MYRDFEQIKQGVHEWVSPCRPKLTRRNPAREFGRLREAKEIQVGPSLLVYAFELRSIIGQKCLYGAIQVAAVSPDASMTSTSMGWGDEFIVFQSPHLGTTEPQEVQAIPGALLDRLYAQIALPLAKVTPITS